MKPWTRRSIMKTASLAAAATTPATAAVAPAAQPERLKLGFDNFSIRALKWKAPKVVEYAASQKADVLLLSDLDVYDNHSPATSPRWARWRGMQGSNFRSALSRSVRPRRASTRNGGPPRSCCGCCSGWRRHRHRSRVASSDSRRTVIRPGGIEARIDDTVTELKKVRTQALDAGVTIAVENHAGDMQAWELVTLIESAGEDFVGGTIDSGNATWAIEDPLQNLEILAPYIVTSGIRDSMIWEYADGAKVQWTAMGDGLVDWKTYFSRWTERAPERPVVLEIISGFARPFEYLKPEFWSAYKNVRPEEFARFLALAKKGREIPPFKPSRTRTDAQYQQEELERSLRYCRESLGLGRK